MSARKAILLPGFGNSGPDHWQTHWEAGNPGFVRLQQQNWSEPDCSQWVKTLENSITVRDRDSLIIAHSLGCLLLAHWAKKTQHRVRAALLVAPPDPHGEVFPPAARGFSPLPLTTLPFPSIVVASSNDPYAGLDFSRELAEAWGSRLINIGEAGHINADSGYGSWNEGLNLLTELA